MGWPAASSVHSDSAQLRMMFNIAGMTTPRPNAMPDSMTPSPTHVPWSAAASPWRAWAWGASLLALLSAITLGTQPDAEGARRLIRLTAWSSLALFLLAFTASAWWRHWPNVVSAALMAHRRQVGLLFATSHACHALGIAFLAAWADAALWAELTPDASRWIGGAGYVAIALMTVTSCDAAVRALGPARWRALHTVCAHLIWTVFLLSGLNRVGANPVYALPLSLLAGAMVLRWWPARPSITPRP